jgi:hypothetical protein
MKAQALEDYFRSLFEIRSTGAATEETSYYPALSNLLNEVGKELKPRVRCILQLANKGAGNPDGGLFTPEQFQKGAGPQPLPGQVPSRGVIEVKGTGDDAWVTADGKQVSKYWGEYHQVLVTNYRDFVLVGQDINGKPVKLETYRLAASEAEFWAKAAHPRALAVEHELSFIEYLRRVMLHAAPLTSPKDVAWFLASYARTARARVEGIDIPAMANVRKALEDALGIQFTGVKGEHFFRSTLVQTLFYGVFSAWVLWNKGRSLTAKEHFDWRTAAWHLRVPMIRKLFHLIADPNQMKELQLSEVLDWTAATLDCVESVSFFEQFEEGQAVQYFYEPFLEAFDPQLRKELGVWYTPPEIVQYMVARIDRVLREELELPDGLADPNVFVLDPCCGTGSYLVEVLRRIALTLKAKGGDALEGSDLKEAAIKRVFGFEILPAPFVVAHLQLGLLLQNLGVPLDGSGHERAGVYLTNALTGWEPLDPEKEKAFQAMLTGFPELLEERDQASRVKQKVPILVILGNPAYNAFAGVSPEEEQGLVEPYKKGLISEWHIKKFNLDDLYVRFFRLAERRIAEQTGRGVVSFISNFSYLGDPSFVVMRQRFLTEFDKLWFDCMNGDSRETGKLTPEGKPDPSVFSTPHNREGIRVGTAIGIMVRKNEREEQPTIRFRHFWGASKRSDLLESLRDNDFYSQYHSVKPSKENRYSFRPQNVAAQYLAWPRLVELATFVSNGLMEKRGGALIDIDQTLLEKRMRMYYDPNTEWASLKSLSTGLTANAAGFEPQKTRDKVLKVETFDSSRILRYALRPFDTRWCFYSAVNPLWNRARPDLYNQYWDKNSFLMSRPSGVSSPEGVPISYTFCLGDNDYLRGHAYYIPIRLQNTITNQNRKPKEQAHLLKLEDVEAKATANLSLATHSYLSSMSIANPDADAKAAGLIWMHALAIGYSPAYLSENADGIRMDWPRVPMSASKKTLLDSAALGEQIATLLDTEHLVSCVTTGDIRSELRLIGVISREGGGQLQEKELAITTGWGHAGKNDAVMPGKGKIVERDYTPEEKDAIQKGAQKLGLSLEQALVQLGKRTCDVYLNDAAYWRNIPVKVWEYYIGGYQVIKKWLSYRDQSLLGRPLNKDEAREVMNMARRIGAVLLLQPALNANYLKCKENAYPWPRPKA